MKRMKRLMYNPKTGEVHITQADPKGSAYQKLTNKGFVPICNISGFNLHVGALYPSDKKELGIPEINKQELIDQVIEEIKSDIENGIEPLEELLQFVNIEFLIGYLPDRF